MFFYENPLKSIMRRLEKIEKAIRIISENIPGIMLDEILDGDTECCPDIPMDIDCTEEEPEAADDEKVIPMTEEKREITEFTYETTEVYPAEEYHLPYDIEIQTLKTKETDHTVPAAAETKIKSEPESMITVEAEEVTEAPDMILAQNFRLSGEEHVHTGAVARYEDNIAAIELLFRLEAENRNAAPDEQEILSHYAGWGGTADAFDPEKPEWHDRYEKLQCLLSEKDYAAARDSVLNAHYTSAVIIRAMYGALEHIGFQSGNILEPSMGIGNFFGCLPDEMSESRLYGVELDSISGRIARKLYPNADITIGGFETTARRDFYDVAIGNVPFGTYRVNDPQYDRLGFSIHNYFFAKALDQVRPGGVVAFVTSRYMMDAKSPVVRNYLAERAVFLGAVRLPDIAFKNAGTDVISDIIFLQKREMPSVEHPAWTETALNAYGMTMNRYFIEHPEMVVGALGTKSSPYGEPAMAVTLPADQDLASVLNDAVRRIEGHYEKAALSVAETDTGKEERTIPASPDVKNYSYVLVGKDIYYREGSVMVPAVWLKENQAGRVSGMINLRDITNRLIDCELNNGSDSDVELVQNELEGAYDRFVSDYGFINTKPNEIAFQKDSAYFLLCSLEKYDEKTKTAEKTAIFTQRTINPQTRPVSADSPKDALAISISERGRVDLPFMAELLGRPEQYKEITDELQGEIFKDPDADSDITAGWQTANEYLSGNVRKKLVEAEKAAAEDSRYTVNVQYLRNVLPKDLEASEIDVRLGAPWVDQKYIAEFMYQTFQTPYYLAHHRKDKIDVEYDEVSGQWHISNKTHVSTYDVAAYETYGTDRMSAYSILEETLNLKDVRIFDTEEGADGKQKRVLNQHETMLAQQKQQAIKDAFQEWIWKDSDRRHDLVKTYNELFNAVHLREYDGSGIRFAGKNSSIELRTHQRNAVARIIYGGNTLLAHEVGAGKTYEMAAAAMELKRLGLCHKSLFVVPKHLILQWASEFMTLYPGANLLVAQKEDFTPANRKKFCARIATGEYDAVIISQSQFEKIPLSYERQAAQLQEQIDEIVHAIAETAESGGSRFSVKQMVKIRKTLETRLEKLNSTERKDDVITFEQLGVDRLFVDEAHFYKNCAKRCA